MCSVVLSNFARYIGFRALQVYVSYNINFFCFCKLLQRWFKDAGLSEDEERSVVSAVNRKCPQLKVVYLRCFSPLGGAVEAGAENSNQCA